MKNLLLTLFVILGMNNASWSQQQSAANRAEWNQLCSVSKSFDQSGQVAQSTIDRFPVYKINGKWYVSLFGKTNGSVNWDFITENNILFGSSVGEITTMKVPLNKVYNLDFGQFYSYLEIPGKIIPDLDRAVKDTHADSVQKGINLPTAFTGKDVLIGITDWGFDYGHPMFYDTLLTNSRVSAAWDQYKQVGNVPNGFTYGVEYVTPAELAAAESDTSNIYSYHTHGSHVAGIAGGSGAGTVYRGFAFEAEYLMTTFYIDAASAIDAFNWMKEKANQAGKRLVVNMSWGVYYNEMGSLDGTSLLSQAMDQFSEQDSIVFVAAAGNNGSVNYHIKKVFNNDSFSSEVKFYNYGANPAMWGECLTMWGEENHPFSSKISVHNAAGSLLVSSPFYSTDGIPFLDSILVVGTDTIFFNFTAESANPLNNKPGMQLKVKNTNTSLKVVLTSQAVDGTVHYWNVAELTNGAGNFGQAFAYYASGSIYGDANYSIGEPTCAASCITVAAYASGYINTQGNPAGGSIASFSSIGPLHNETMKPDISAPGVNVASSISSYTDAAYTGFSTITFNGKDYDFGRLSGTSMATPCVAGIVALILDANPTLTPAEIKDIIKTTARLDSHTGNITAPGDVRWGMGKINAYQAIVLAIDAVSLEELESNHWITIYPNPGSGNIYLLTSENSVLTDLQLITLDGKVLPLETMNGMIQTDNLESGTYFIRAILNGKNISKQFIKID